MSLMSVARVREEAMRRNSYHNQADEQEDKQEDNQADEQEDKQADEQEDKQLVEQ